MQPSASNQGLAHPLRRKTVQELRSEFKADFDAAASTDADCLTPEEILSLQSGAELEPVALEHLAHCRFCSSLRQAIEVDPVRVKEFRTAVRSIQPPEGRIVRSTSFDWRLPMATFTGIAGVVMVLLMTRNAANVTNAKGSVTQASVAPQIEIALTRPSESPLRVLAKKGAQLTVSDVAPQLGTAVVLSKSEITMPLGTSPAFAAAAKQATNDVVHKWLSSNDTLISFKSPSIAYVPTRKGFELKLPGKAVVWLPEEALKDGLSTKQAVLRTSRPRLDLALDRAMGLKLDDGSVVTLKSID